MGPRPQSRDDSGRVREPADDGSPRQRRRPVDEDGAGTGGHGRDRVASGGREGRRWAIEGRRRDRRDVRELPQEVLAELLTPPI